MSGEEFPAETSAAEAQDEERQAEELDSTLRTLGRLGMHIEGEAYQALTPEVQLLLRRRQLLLERFEQAYVDINSTMLRAHQIDGVDGLYDFVMLSNASDEDFGLTKRGALTHAPGSGKSIFAAEVSSMFGVGLPLGDLPPVRVLYLTHDRKGLGQTMGKDDILRGFAKVSPDTKTIMVEKGRSFRDVPVVGMTYSAMRHWYRRCPDVFKDFDIIFADESHEAMGPKTLDTLAHIMPGKINIALTGSPELADERTVFDVWPERIHNISFREGVEERGILNSFILYSFKTGEVLKSVKKHGEYVPAAYSHLAKNEFLREHTQRLALLFASHNIKTVIFAFRGGGSKHAIDLATALNSRTVLDRSTGLPRPARASAIGQFQSQSKNTEAFAKFDRGELDVITTTHMGETAWDPQDLNAIILVCPTRSLRALIQRLGRGARIGSRPTVIVHYDYDDEKQHSPYDVFGEPEIQGAVIAAKQQQQPQREYGTTGKDQERNNARQLPDPDGLFTSLGELMALTEVRAWRRETLRRGSRDIRDHGYEPLAPIAQAYGIDQLVLSGLLRRNRIRVINLEIDDEAMAYGPAEAVRKFIEEEVARPQTYHAAQLIAELGMSRKWVYSRIKDEPAERRFARDSLEVSRRSHYPQSVYDRLLKERSEKAADAQKNEISIVELSKKYGPDFTRTTDWFSRRGIRAISRKRTDTSVSGRSDIQYFPQKYEAQFAWHWGAEQLPEDGQFIPLARVFDRSPRLKKMGHAQREELLAECQITPQRFRTKTNFNYFITREEQLRLSQAANRSAIRPDENYVGPGISASRIAHKRDKELFMQYLAKNNLPLTTSFLAIQETHDNTAPTATEPAKTKSTKTTPQETLSKPEEDTNAPADKAAQTGAQPMLVEGVAPWNADEGLLTAITVARRLHGYAATSASVVAYAHEHDLPVLKRTKNDQVFLCMKPDDAAKLVEQYKESIKLDSAETVATVLQVPRDFVVDIAADHLWGHDETESGETEEAHGIDEDEALLESHIHESIKKTREMTPERWKAVHQEILVALRSLGIGRPAQGRLLDDHTLDRVRARLIVIAEPLINEIVSIAAQRDYIERQKKENNTPSPDKDAI